MVKKSIAAALLVVIVAWAEMALAPMLVMHAWPMHSAREMSAHAVAHHHAMAADHPCCPKIGKTENAPPFEVAASGLPCQDEHRCCVLQGSHSVPAPVNAGRRLSQEIAVAEIDGFTPAQADSQVSPMSAVAPGPPSGPLDMVLRV